MPSRNTPPPAAPTDAGSPRRAELLASAYAYAIEHGLADLSLRPLAAATGTSPRVLLYLFGSKDGLVREILARGRQEQLAFVHRLAAEPVEPSADRYPHVVDRLWQWASAPRRRGLIRLFFEAYTRSVAPEPGPWRGYAEQSIQDIVDVLVAAQPDVPPERAVARATQTLALLRGLLLHLLARGDRQQLGRLLRDAVRAGL
ncbi:TetR/AcrR family transcriptional regulator [Phytohabitans sp. ZYX-F-186]|uniref:TetR/AcrR family transcriptional regulator n=1 Tax=Phytohabitans maris TaxID=3071409 RepID=A0ABU0ZVW3_9ACTN|nr:TetR/AcrR family transcriptional regulator [Phytohabitans sp. ZYX-F-186]MDQ7911176.1 TetR/AcrR family transcriptional regulator [Phytohabitans sp. ZYX-F-186]